MSAAVKKQAFGGRVAERRRRMRNIRIGIAAFLVVAIFAGIAYATRLPSLTIKEISVSGTQAVSPSDIEATARASMQRTWALLILKTNAFFYPSGGIKKDILAAYPRISLVTIDPQGLTGLSITVNERQPHALWCAETAAGTSTQPSACYFVDESGYIFDRAPGFSGAAYLSYETPIEGDPLRQQALPVLEFDKASTFLGAISNDLGIGVEKLVIATTSEADIYLSGGGRIIYDRSQDLQPLFKNIQTVFTSGELSGDKRAKLDYADFRYGSKVYFKLK